MVTKSIGVVMSTLLLSSSFVASMEDKVSSIEDRKKQLFYKQHDELVNELSRTTLSPQDIASKLGGSANKNDIGKLVADIVYKRFEINKDPLNEDMVSKAEGLRNEILSLCKTSSDITIKALADEGFQKAELKEKGKFLAKTSKDKQLGFLNTSQLTATDKGKLSSYIAEGMSLNKLNKNLFEYQSLNKKLELKEETTKNDGDLRHAFSNNWGEKDKQELNAVPFQYPALEAKFG